MKGHVHSIIVCMENKLICFIGNILVFVASIEKELIKVCTKAHFRFEIQVLRNEHICVNEGNQGGNVSEIEDIFDYSFVAFEFHSKNHERYFAEANDRID